MPLPERLASLLLIAAAILALALANSPAAAAWAAFWHNRVAGLPLELWVNDALMAVFFLLIGLELKRELVAGQLCTRDRALLPVIAALGGMIVPALIHYALNAGTPAARGFGIPMATDIAFTLGVLSLLRGRVPPALRAFVVAFAVIDDLGAILVIALFYSDALAWPWLGGVLVLWLAMLGLNRLLGVRALTPYLIAGAALWWLMLRSGLHATLAGVLLALVIPFRRAPEPSPSMRLERALAAPVALVVLPVFALANTGVSMELQRGRDLIDANVLGIVCGLMLGKPLGIGLACLLALQVLRLQSPEGLTLKHFVGAGLLGGIGFTMALFIADLAFAGNAASLAASKLAILTASTLSAVAGLTWLAIGAGPVVRARL